MKLVQGNAGKRNPGTAPIPEPYRLDKPPSWLKGRVARAKWRELSGQLQACGILAETDLPALALLCGQFQIYEDALLMVQAEGFVVESTKRTPVKHPAMRVMDGAHDRIIRLMQDFGLTPASRSGVTVVAGYGEGSNSWSDLDEAT